MLSQRAWSNSSLRPGRRWRCSHRTQLSLGSNRPLASRRDSASHSHRRYCFHPGRGRLLCRLYCSAAVARTSANVGVDLPPIPAAGIPDPTWMTNHGRTAVTNSPQITFIQVSLHACRRPTTPFARLRGRSPQGPQAGRRRTGRSTARVVRHGLLRPPARCWSAA